MSHEKTGEKQVTLTIDGRNVTASATTTILEAARSIGVHIPTLCYHARLTPIGSCRVCLVKVDGQDGPAASCTTPVCQDMVVTTDDQELAALRRQAIQFLLLNHPLECPVCDKAGECELQDITYKLDVHHQDYEMSKVTWENDTQSPLIFRSDARCIRCGRCVAICNEVQNAGAIDFVLRGYDTHIAPTQGEVLDCEFCGQCVSVCPVGALLAKPFLNKIRVWDVEETETVCAFCGAGCAVTAHTRDNTLYRVVSDRDATHNRGDLCVRGTFGFEFIESDQRGAVALERTEQGQVEIDADLACEKVANQFKAIAQANGPGSVAGLGSARMPNEDAFAFSKWIREIVGSPHLDTEAGLGYRQLHARMYGGPVGTFDDLEQCDAILVFGSDLGVEMPVPALRIVAAAKQHDARVVAAAPYSTKLHAVSRAPLVYTPGAEKALAMALAKIAVENHWIPKAVCEHPKFAEVKQALDVDVADLCAQAGVDEALAQKAAKAFFTGTRRAVIAGPYAYKDNAARNGIALLTWLSNPSVFLLSAERANAQGVSDVGCVPGPEGKDYQQILKGIENGEIKALWVAGSDPVSLLGNAADALGKLELLVVQDPFLSPAARLAHVYLPVASWGQKGGTTTSTEGRVQRLGQALPNANDRKTDAQWFAQATGVLGLPFQGDRVALAQQIAQTVSGYAGTVCEPEGENVFASLPKKRRVQLVPPAPTGGAMDGFVLVRGATLPMNGLLGSYCKHLRVLCPDTFVALSPKTMESLGLEQDGLVELKTASGSLKVQARSDDHIPENVGLLIDNFPGSGVSALFENVAAKAKARITKA